MVPVLFSFIIAQTYRDPVERTVQNRTDRQLDSFSCPLPLPFLLVPSLSRQVSVGYPTCCLCWLVSFHVPSRRHNEICIVVLSRMHCHFVLSVSGFGCCCYTCPLCFRTGDPYLFFVRDSFGMICGWRRSGRWRILVVGQRALSQHAVAPRTARCCFVTVLTQNCYCTCTLHDSDSH